MKFDSVMTFPIPWLLRPAHPRTGSLGKFKVGSRLSFKRETFSISSLSLLTFAWLNSSSRQFCQPTLPLIKSHLRESGSEPFRVKLNTVRWLQYILNISHVQPIYRVCQGSWRSWTTKLNHIFFSFSFTLSELITLRIHQKFKAQAICWRTSSHTYW